MCSQDWQLSFSRTAITPLVLYLFWSASWSFVIYLGVLQRKQWNGHVDYFWWLPALKLAVVITYSATSDYKVVDVTVFPFQSLHWRHNEHDGVSNHQPHHCFLNRLFRRRSRKTSKLRVTGRCVGNSPGPVNSPHKGPATRKMFPFDDVIMEQQVLQSPTPQNT